MVNTSRCNTQMQWYATSTKQALGHTWRTSPFPTCLRLCEAMLWSNCVPKNTDLKQSILNCIQCPVYTKSQIGKQATCQWQEQFVFLNAFSRFLSSKSSLIGIELPADAAAAVMGACLKREDIETASDPEMKKNRNSSERSLITVTDSDGLEEHEI